MTEPARVKLGPLELSISAEKYADSAPLWLWYIWVDGGHGRTVVGHGDALGEQVALTSANAALTSLVEQIAGIGKAERAALIEGWNALMNHAARFDGDERRGFEQQAATLRRLAGRGKEGGES